VMVVVRVRIKGRPALELPHAEIRYWVGW